MKRKRTGLTIVEILVVVGIIALLTGILVPAVHMVRTTAREVKQKAQFTAISLGLAAFKNDDGDYPPSDHVSWLEYEDGTGDVPNSSGAQKLAEALLGWDLLGFHPDSGFRADGTNRWTYTVRTDAGPVAHAPGTYWLYDRNSTIDLEKRKGRYIEMDTGNPFRLGMGGITSQHDGLYDLARVGSPLASAADTFVLCDVFGKGKDVILQDGQRVKAGVPILYYRANASERDIRRVYEYTNNDTLVYTKELVDRAEKGTVPPDRSGGPDPSWNPLAGNADVFYQQIADPRASTPGAYDVPYRPDSYLLISAGADGFYGTDDDICNFRK